MWSTATTHTAQRLVGQRSCSPQPDSWTCHMLWCWVCKVMSYLSHSVYPLPPPWLLREFSAFLLHLNPSHYTPWGLMCIPHIKPHGHDGVHYVFMTCSRLFLLSPFACLTLVPLSFVLFAPDDSLIPLWLFNLSSGELKKQQQKKQVASRENHFSNIFPLPKMKLWWTSEHTYWGLN